MADSIVRVGGRSKQVQRAFRADNQARGGLFYAREFANVLVLSLRDSGPPTPVCRITPGSFVYALNDAVDDPLLANKPYSFCMTRRDCLAVFYVLELLSFARG